MCSGKNRGALAGVKFDQRPLTGILTPYALNITFPMALKGSTNIRQSLTQRAERRDPHRKDTQVAPRTQRQTQQPPAL